MVHDLTPAIIALGEPLLEFNAEDPGSLRDVRQYEVGWGGDTSNFAVAARRLGGDVGYVCRIGDDEFGAAFLDLWKSEGVDTSHVIIEKGSKTGIYFISRSGEEHSFTYYRKGSAASHYSTSDVPKGYLARARLLHTSGISQAISNSSCDAVYLAIEIARENGVLVSYDPNVRLKLWELPRARAIVLETIRQADFVLPSLEDANLITGLTDPEAIVESLLALGPRAIVLKLGPKGALVGSNDEVERVESPDLSSSGLSVVDTTGAGDTFDAAFAVGYLEGQSIIESARFATTAAALVTTGRGAVGPIPTRGKVDSMIERIAQS